MVGSCTKYLDVKPVGQLIPSKVEELENLLNNTNTLENHFVDNNQGSFYAFLGDNLRISDNQIKYLYTNTHPNVDRYAAYTFYHPYTDPNKPQWVWNNGVYRATALFNTVVDEVEKMGAGATELGKIITAQAKAGRAWSYMVAGLSYGPMYNPNGSNDQRVIPYRVTGSPNTPNPELATTAQIMDLVEKDLKDALTAPAQVATPVRANLAAVHGLLAQLYMFKRDWPKMSEHAETAWSLSLAQRASVDQLIYNYNQLYYREDPNASPTPGTDVEVSLELMGPDNLLLQSTNREQLFYRTGAYGYNVYPSTEFINLFDPETDMRHKLFMLKALGYSTTVAGVKHDDGIQSFYYRDNKMIRSQGLTYPEVLLMKAEANARLNQLGKALTDLNTLRKYRYKGTNTDLANGTTLNQDQLLHEILKERRRELPVGTFQRTLDLKRFVYDTGKPWSKTKIERTIAGKTYSANLDSKFYTLEISNAIILLNPAWGLQTNDQAYLPVRN